MTKDQKIKKLKKEKKALSKNMDSCVEHLHLAAGNLMEGADLITYMSGQIAAYRDCLGLED